MEQLPPTKRDVVSKLDALNSGVASRADVASWALALIEDDNLRIIDRSVLGALKRLGAVDLPASDREFLYTTADFDEWKAELLRS